MKKVNLKSAFTPIIFFGLGILVTILFIVVYTFLTRPRAINTLGKWEKPASNKMGYPVVDKKTNELLIYDLEDKKLKKTDAQGSNPLSSPSLLYTAYLDNRGLSLKLLSSSLLKSTDIDNIDSEYVLVWSSDSNKLIYSKRDGELASGVPKLYTWLYDVKQNNKFKITEGRPLQWVDDNNIIVSRQSLDGEDVLWTLYLVNLKSGVSTKIY